MRDPRSKHEYLEQLSKECDVPDKSDKCLEARERDRRYSCIKNYLVDAQ